MNIDEIIDNGESESRELDYKHPDATIEDLVKELTAIANSGGGAVIVGVEESEGEIVDVHDVSAPSQTEESIQQHIREKVDPELSVTHSVEQYTGETGDYRGREILILTAEPGRELYSYIESGSSILFPYRLGSTTDYLTGGQVHRFYQSGIWPGRPEVESEEVDSESRMNGNSNTEENGSNSNPWDEIATAVASFANESQQKKNDSESQPSTSSDEISSMDLELQSSENPYHFTPAGGLETFTFHHVPYYPNAYGIEGYSIHAEKSDLKFIFASLKKYFDADIESGHFTITQRNSAWFGQGAGDFLAALDVEDRYRSVPESFTIDKHHSEGTIFVIDSRIGTIVVRSRRGINVAQEHLDQFAVSFCTDGVPVDTEDLTEFLDVLDYDLHHAHPFEMERENLHFGSYGIEVEPIKLLRAQRNDDYAAWAICRNPFYDQPELLLEDIDSDSRDFSTLTKYKNIPCRIKDYHPINEPHSYELLRASITPLTPVQGTTPHANAMIWINW